MANWELIKEQYCSGIPPRELATKHKVKANTISIKASEEKWGEEKQRKTKEIANNFKKEINELVNLSLPELKAIITNPESRESEKIQAIKVVMDISGLKKETTENLNKNLNYEPVNIIVELPN